MAERSPRDWSPRQKWVWVMIKDEPRGGYDVEVFVKEEDAYAYVVGSALPWVSNKFDDEEAGHYKKLTREKKFEEAVEYYHEIVEGSGMEKMPYYTIIEKELL